MGPLARAAAACAVLVLCAGSAAAARGAGGLRGLAGAEHTSLLCEACAVLATVGDSWINSPPGLALEEMLVTAVCEKLEQGKECTGGWQCRDVCTGAVREHAAIVMRLLAQSKLSPSAVCNQALHCDLPQEQLPASLVPVVSLASEQPVLAEATASGSVLHFSDIHYESMYQEGLDTQCGEPICCRAIDGQAPTAERAAGRWGDYSCDSPEVLVASALDFAGSLPSPPRFVLWTGDNPPHNIWNQSHATNLQALRDVTGMVKHGLGSVAVFPSLGNHASAPVNQFGGPGVDSWLYDAVADAWAHWLPASALRSLRFGGYYTALIEPGLRVVALNTNLFVSDNFYTWLNRTDFGGQKAWAGEVVRQAAALHQRVIFIGHHSTIHWLQPDADWMQSLLRDYPGTIEAYFFGHTHSDQFHVVHQPGTAATPIAVQYVAASITPVNGRNPSFHFYQYARNTDGAAGAAAQLDPSTWHVTDFGSYWANLTDANIRGSPRWGLEYTATQYYGLAGVGPADMQALGESFLANTTALATYLDAYRARYPVPVGNARSWYCSVLSSSNAEGKACSHAQGLAETAVLDLMRAHGAC